MEIVDADVDVESDVERREELWFMALVEVLIPSMFIIAAVPVMVVLGFGVF